MGVSITKISTQPTLSVRMIVSLFLCIALLSPCVLSSIENCTATTCLRCSPKVTPICTELLKDGDDSLLYNVYCEPPLSSLNCEEKNVTGLDDYCVVLLHKSNVNGQWTYQAFNFQFQPKHNNCSNVNGNPILPHCLNLYSEVTTVEEIGQNIFCRCYEDDCQKRINITYRVTGNIVTNVSSSSLISPTTSSIIVNDDKTPSVTTNSVSADDDKTYSVTTSSVSADDDKTHSVTTSSVSADDDRTLTSLLKASSTLLTLSAIGTQSSTSIVSTVLPTNSPNSLTDALMSK